MEGNAQARTGHWEPYKINGLGPRNGCPAPPPEPTVKVCRRHTLPYRELSMLWPGSERPVKLMLSETLPLPY